MGLSSPTLGLRALAAVLKFLIVVEQGLLNFHLAPGLANYVQVLFPRGLTQLSLSQFPLLTGGAYF